MLKNLKSTFIDSLPADQITDNYVRHVTDACYSFVIPTPCSSPSLIHVSPSAIDLIDLNFSDKNTNEFLQIFSGNKVVAGSKPFAMRYGGHQFGHWAGQLGDGRAINLFEIGNNQSLQTVQLKGAGMTPYSRTADGLAVLRSSIREYLCSEAMFHLGIPTTRAASLILTGDQVLRDMLYNGNSAYEPGAIVTRIAPTFIRFGNFQIHTARQEMDVLKKLADYTILHYFPYLGGLDDQLIYLKFLKEVAVRTIDLIIEWERVGFVHGVMNTDNMSILGLTIDYGPYGWVEDFDLDWTPNTTDAQGKRYRFGNQADVAIWNLYQLANALYPLIGEVQPIEDILKSIQTYYPIAHQKMMNKKLGLHGEYILEINAIADFEYLLQKSQMDMTLFFRELSYLTTYNFQAFINKLPSLSYSENFEAHQPVWIEWLQDYVNLVTAQDDPNRMEKMKKVNPKYIFRNYMAQIAIDAAHQGDYSFIDEFFQLLTKPYDEQPNQEKWYAKRPDWATQKVGCSMLSCSS